MTTRPKLKLGNHLVPGLVAVALFVVMAAVFINAPITGEEQGFNEATVKLGPADEVATQQTDSGAYAQIKEADGSTYAVVVDGDSETKNVTLSDSTNASTSLFTRDGDVYAATSDVGEGVTDDLGYHLFGLGSSAEPTVPGESFLVAFEIIDLVLVAALVGAVMLARREVGGEVVSALGLGLGDDDSVGNSSAAGVAADGGTDISEDGGEH